jgi:hypothetical protein
MIAFNELFAELKILPASSNISANFALTTSLVSKWLSKYAYKIDTFASNEVSKA